MELPDRSEWKIINRQLYHFFRADIGLGMAIAAGSGVNVEESRVGLLTKATRNGTVIRQVITPMMKLKRGCYLAASLFF